MKSLPTTDEIITQLDNSDLHALFNALTRVSKSLGVKTSLIIFNLPHPTVSLFVSAETNDAKSSTRFALQVSEDMAKTATDVQTHGVM